MESSRWILALKGRRILLLRNHSWQIARSLQNKLLLHARLALVRGIIQANLSALILMRNRSIVELFICCLDGILLYVLGTLIARRAREHGRALLIRLPHVYRIIICIIMVYQQ